MPPPPPQASFGAWFPRGDDSSPLSDTRGIIASVYDSPLIDNGTDPQWAPPPSGGVDKDVPHDVPPQVDAMLGHFTDYFTDEAENDEPDSNCDPGVAIDKGDQLTSFFNCFVSESSDEREHHRRAAALPEVGGLGRTREEHMDRFVSCLEDTDWYQEYLQPVADFWKAVQRVREWLGQARRVVRLTVDLVGSGSSALAGSPYISYYVVPFVAAVSAPLARCCRLSRKAKARHGEAYQTFNHDAQLIDTVDGPRAVDTMTMWLMLFAFTTVNQVLLWLFDRTHGLNANLTKSSDPNTWTDPDLKQRAVMVRRVTAALRYVLRVRVVHPPLTAKYVKDLFVRELRPRDRVLDLMRLVAYAVPEVPMSHQVLQLDDPTNGTEVSLQEHPDRLLEAVVPNDGVVRLSVKSAGVYVEYPPSLNEGWGPGRFVRGVGPNDKVIAVKEEIAIHTGQPVHVQTLEYEGTLLDDDHATLGAYEVPRNDARLILSVPDPAPRESEAPPPDDEPIAPVGFLVVRELEGRHLVKKDWFFKSDPYVRLVCGNEERRTTHKNNTLNPVWRGEELMLLGEAAQLRQRELQLLLADKDWLTPDDALGGTGHRLDWLREEEAQEHAESAELVRGRSASTGQQGRRQAPATMRYKVCWNPCRPLSTLSRSKYIWIYLDRAIDLRPMDATGFSDPYCIITLDGRAPDPRLGSAAKSKVIRQSLHPVWQQSFAFPISDGKGGDEASLLSRTRLMASEYGGYAPDLKLKIEVYDYDGKLASRMGRNDFLGVGVFNLERKWYLGASIGKAIEVDLFVDGGAKRDGGSAKNVLSLNRTGTSLKPAGKVILRAAAREDVDEAEAFEAQPEPEEETPPRSRGSVRHVDEDADDRAGRVAAEQARQLHGASAGELTMTLTWSETTDLDLYVKTPNGGTIYFGEKRGQGGGYLDVDNTAGGQGSCENVFWKSKPPHGRYRVEVLDHSKRESSTSTPFNVDVLVGQRNSHFVCKPRKHRGPFRVCEFEFDGHDMVNWIYRCDGKHKKMQKDAEKARKSAERAEDKARRDAEKDEERRKREARRATPSGGGAALPRTPAGNPDMQHMEERMDRDVVPTTAGAAITEAADTGGGSAPDSSRDRSYSGTERFFVNRSRQKASRAAPPA